MRTAGSSGGIVRLLFESAAGSEADPEAMGAEVAETGVLPVTVFMWPSLQWGLTHSEPAVKGRRNTFLLYFCYVGVFLGCCTRWMESAPVVTPCRISKNP